VTDRKLLDDLNGLVEPEARGDPMSQLRWTCKSLRRLAAELAALGHRVSHTRSATLPGGGILEQSDGTAWMAKYCLIVLEMALRLANYDRSYAEMAVKFFEHFAKIAVAMGELWDEEDGFFYDRLRKPDGKDLIVRSRSIVGLLPIFAAVELNASLWERLPNFRARANWFMAHKPHLTKFLSYFTKDNRPELVGLLDETRLRRVLAQMLDEAEFLSPYGLRSLSRFHRDHPLVLDLGGGSSVRLDYEPGESQTALFGGNSNWRGPIWFPLNFLALESLRNLHGSLGDRFTVEMPTGSGSHAHLGAAADEIERRLLRMFLRDADGRRPVNGGNRRFDQDPAWSDLRLRSATWSSRQRKARGGAETRWRSRKGINPFTKEPAIFKAKPARKIIRAHPVKAAKDAVS